MTIVMIGLFAEKTKTDQCGKVRAKIITPSSLKNNFEP